VKIFCIGRNYADHAKEMKSKVPDNPMVFMKPVTSMLRNNKAFYHPEFSENIHYECELVIKICRHAKHVEPKFAHKYYNKIALGIDFTARDLQSKFKEKGHPWELAKGFDHSAAITEFYDFDTLKNKENIHFALMQNGVKKQIGESKDMIFNFEKLICYISKFITIQVGDIIFTGTPAGVGKVEIGDVLECYLEDEKKLTCEIR